jgi:outer membrane protein assembly factor BamB
MGWWIICSRARWFERLLGLVGIIAVISLVIAVSDRSMGGPLVIVMTIPMAIAGFAIGLILLGSRLSISRTTIALVLALIGAGVSALTKTDGVWGNFAFGLDWRWNKTAEEEFLASRKNGPADPSAAKIEASRDVFLQPEWPGFRGPLQDGVQHGKSFSSDWKANPPKELWRIPLGPAWSSFAVAGKYLVTQEQRGEFEAVVCYESESGKQVWANETPSRFFEALGGLGPRATPTIAEGSIFSMGAEGWLLKLNATNGELLWKVDIRKAAECDPPMWGFSSSPLVYEGIVTVHAGGKGDKGIVAFDSSNGELKWSAPAGKQSYSSPQILTIHDQKVLTLLSDEGAHFYEPLTGKSVYDYEWPHQGYRALQAQIVEANQMLVPTGLGAGTRLVEFTKENDLWVGKEIWTSRFMKPDYNDLVVHKGYLYGFDSAIFACVDLKDGSQKWKGGRYGKGQVLLLADSDLLIVVSEKGELVLLRASPDAFDELAKINAMEGKTWNHPVVVGDRLYIRNAEEAICYQLQ